MKLKSGIFTVFLLSALSLSGCIIVSNDSKPAAAAPQSKSSLSRSHFFVVHCTEATQKDGYSYKDAVALCSCYVNESIKRYGSSGTKELLEGPISKKDERVKLRPVVEACYNRHIGS
ncbi:hypothetical protein [Neisseria sp. CCUG12390]|uniref:hypothetical protein n=1 Tax=Neisseria sp. CCUG12390 TaxID=3392035 RepID=UPI003A0FC5CD